MLWDTGLSDESAADPNGVEVFGGRFRVRRTLAAQLAELELKPDYVRYVGSHRDLDHTGNIYLFPKSAFLIGTPELAWPPANPTPFGIDLSSFNTLDQDKVNALDDDHDVLGDGTVCHPPDARTHSRRASTYSSNLRMPAFSQSRAICITRGRTTLKA
jgi:hypothetical protein